MDAEGKHHYLEEQGAPAINILFVSPSVTFVMKLHVNEMAV